MLVRRILAPGGAKVSYLVACRESSRAVVIDPDPSVQAELEAVAREAGLCIELVLSTRPCIAGGDAAHGRMDDLLLELSRVFDEGPSGLGEAATEGRPAIAPAATWVRPAPPWAANADDPTPLPSVFTLLRADRRVIELWPPGPLTPDTALVSLTDATQAPFALSASRAELRVGALVFSVLPLGGQCDAVAYLVRGRLFTGQSLYTGSSRFTADCTDDALLDLPEDTVVHPGEAAHGVQVATVGQEREWRAARAEGAVPAAEARGGWVPVVHDGGRGPMQVGRPTAAGFRDVEPSEILPLMASVRVVEVRLPREDEPGIAGAQLVSPTSWQAELARLDRAQPLLVVSPMGVRCAAVATGLVQEGFHTVFRLVGGLNLWVDSGLPVDLHDDSASPPAAPNRLHRKE